MTRQDLILPLLGAGILVMVAAGLAQRLPGDAGGMDLDRTYRYVAFACVAGVLYAGAIWQVGRRSGAALPAVLVLGLVMRLLTFASPPLLSTDIYRYVWDGRVQAAGINPYLYLPAAPELRGLRDDGTAATAIYPHINRAYYAPTIYPPVAQGLFALVGVAWPTIWGMKAVMLAFDLLGIGAVLALLRLARQPAERVLILAWNPLVVWEFAGGGHIDAAALGFVGLMLVLAARRRRALAGLALGAAVLCKLLPAALFPAVWRRWDLRTPLAAGALIAVSYAYYAGAGWRVLGYLPGYASEEGLGSGSGFLLLRLIAMAGPLPSWAGLAYAATAAVGLLALAGWIGLRGPLPEALADRAVLMCRDAVWLVMAVMFALSPHYPWYLTALAVPCVLVPSRPAVWLMGAAPLLYLDDRLMQVAAPAVVFLPAAALAAYDLFRHRVRRGALPA
jgi:alpha-1,6-mannosyltransferase